MSINQTTGIYTADEALGSYVILATVGSVVANAAVILTSSTLTEDTFAILNEDGFRLLTEG